MSLSWVSSFDHMASAAIFQLLMHITMSLLVWRHATGRHGEGFNVEPSAISGPGGCGHSVCVCPLLCCDGLAFANILTVDSQPGFWSLGLSPSWFFCTTADSFIPWPCVFTEEDFLSLPSFSAVVSTVWRSDLIFYLPHCRALGSIWKVLAMGLCPILVLLLMVCGLGFCFLCFNLGSSTRDSSTGCHVTPALSLSPSQGHFSCRF